MQKVFVVRLNDVEIAYDESVRLMRACVFVYVYVCMLLQNG